MSAKSTIIIRPYRPSDKKQLVAAIEALQDHFVSMDMTGTFTRQPGYGKTYAKYIQNEVKKHNGVIYVAMDGKQMVGFVSGAVYKKSKFEMTYTIPKVTGWVLLLYVDPNYRDQKLGTQLMDKLEQYFTKKKCDIVRLEAAGSHTSPYEYYKRRGYHAWSVDMIKPLKRKK